MRYSNTKSEILLKLLLLVLLLTGCAASPTATPEPITLKLNWRHGTGFLGFYIAQEQGYYAEEGLDVTIEPVSDPAETSAIAGRVAAGEYEFGLGSQGLYLAQGEGVPVTAVAGLYQLGPSVVFARTDSGITTLADLAGRSVVVQSKAWQALLETLLAHGDLTLDDLEAVPGGFDMTPFLEGEVEVRTGYLNNKVVRARQQGVEVVTFPLDEYGIRTFVTAIFGSESLLSQNPDLATRFVRASLRGYEWAVENPSEAVDVMVEMFPEMAGEREFHLAAFDAAIPLIRVPGTRIGTIDCEYWRSHELLAGLDSEELCTNTILNTIWEGE